MRLEKHSQELEAACNADIAKAELRIIADPSSAEQVLRELEDILVLRFCEFQHQHAPLSGRAVLTTIAACLRLGRPVPDWLALDFVARVEAVNNAQAGSWDEAFGHPFKKGVKAAHLSRLRNRRAALPKILASLRKLLQEDPEAPLDPAWDAIARGANVGRSLAQELFYAAVRSGTARSLEAERARARTRKKVKSRG